MIRLVCGHWFDRGVALCSCPARYGSCVDDDALVLVELKPRKKRIYWYVFEPSHRFVKPWWRREQIINGNEHWLSIERGGTEVARCKFILHDGPRSHPSLGSMPHGQLDILALEVATEEQRHGIGREALLAIREMYPLPRLTALNDDAGSRGFWDRVGWARHESKWGFFSERVTYSEMAAPNISPQQSRFLTLDHREWNGTGD